MFSIRGGFDLFFVVVYVCLVVFSCCFVFVVDSIFLRGGGVEEMVTEAGSVFLN